MSTSRNQANSGAETSAEAPDQAMIVIHPSTGMRPVRLRRRVSTSEPADHEHGRQASDRQASEAETRATVRSHRLALTMWGPGTFAWL